MKLTATVLVLSRLAVLCQAGAASSDGQEAVGASSDSYGPGGGGGDDDGYGSGDKGGGDYGGGKGDGYGSADKGGGDYGGGNGDGYGTADKGRGDYGGGNGDGYGSADKGRGGDDYGRGGGDDYSSTDSSGGKTYKGEDSTSDETDKDKTPEKGDDEKKGDDENEFTPDFYRIFLGDNSNYFRKVLRGESTKAKVEAASLGPRALSQRKTNGYSKLGTLEAPYLPRYLGNNPLPNGKPWSRYNHHTNYYKKCPNTGVIRKYNFTISRTKLAPDGVEASVLLVNGAYPGPLIEANWGDTIQVTVNNEIKGPDEGTALHWHGFLQTGTPWQDGVPGVDFCPIPPGKSFTYQFQAELYGSTWYHSHYSSQYAGGLVGPMVIYGPETEHYDVDVGPVMLSDWYHPDYNALVRETMKVGTTTGVMSDNNLINGKMNYNCSDLTGGKRFCQNNAGLSKFKFKRGKKHRLRLVNSGAEALQRFSIDGHEMTVIANDFVPVEPYKTKVVTLGIGQRSDVIVEAKGYEGSYWMRSTISHNCSLAHQDDALAAIYYDDAHSYDEVPRTKAWKLPDQTCLNDDLSKTVPVMKLPVPKPDLALVVNLDLHRNASNITLWRLAGQDFRINYNSPTLLLSALGNTSFEPEWNVHNLGGAKSVRVVVNNVSPAAHPMHLHGFNMYILSVANGTWDGKIVRPSNPQRRDVIQLPSQHHLAMQFDSASNPGMWPFHCHIAWHASAGLVMQFLSNPDKVRELSVPHTVAHTCRQWAKWTNTNIPDQIDSGL